MTYKTGLRVAADKRKKRYWIKRLTPARGEGDSRSLRATLCASKFGQSLVVCTPDRVILRTVKQRVADAEIGLGGTAWFCELAQSL